MNLMKNIKDELNKNLIHNHTEQIHILGVPLIKIKSINYYAVRFHDTCIKHKIKLLGLPLAKILISPWFYVLSFLGVPCVCFKHTNEKKSLRICGIPLLKIKYRGNKKIIAAADIRNGNMLFKSDLHRNLMLQNRIIERKLSTFALHQKVFPQFKGIHKGKDIVIVATGPSLSDFQPIRDAIYIGVNRAIQFDKVHYDYYFVQDFSGATPTYIKQICNYKNCIKFIGLTSENTAPERTIPEIYSEGRDCYRYRTDWEKIPSFETEFAYDLSTTALGCGGTVVLPALQFALWTHPKKIYLVGCDTTTLGYFDNKQQYGNFLDPSLLIQRYKQLKNFATQYYPDVKIISINPVGLIGIFCDLYQQNPIKLQN